jgi:hypothetical protein
MTARPVQVIRPLAAVAVLVLSACARAPAPPPLPLPPAPLELSDETWAYNTLMEMSLEEALGPEDDGVVLAHAARTLARP